MEVVITYPKALISVLTVTPPVLHQETLLEKIVGKAKATIWLQIIKHPFKGKIKVYLEQTKVDEIDVDAQLPGFYKYVSRYFDVPGVCKETDDGIYCRARAYTVTAELYDSEGNKISEMKTKIWVSLF